MDKNTRISQTVEFVTIGHPDKVADQISDAILDELLTQDRYSRVACETFVTHGLVIVGGEITTNAFADVDGVVRSTIDSIGYNHPKYGFDAKTCAVVNAIGRQSPDIAQGVDAGGAGDQGIMLSLLHISEPTRLGMISYAVFCLKKKNKTRKK